MSDSYSVKNNVRATVKLSATGLDPYSAYNVLFNNQVVDNSIFTTNKYGGNTAIEFQVPLIKDGDYKVQLTKASESTSITTYKGDNTESSLNYTIVSDIVFNPSSTFIADQMVFFSWDSDINAGSAFKTITIKLDDTTILNGQINYPHPIPAPQCYGFNLSPLVEDNRKSWAVSYTHLTLPTNREV